MTRAAALACALLLACSHPVTRTAPPEPLEGTLYCVTIQIRHAAATAPLIGCARTVDLCERGRRFARLRGSLVGVTAVGECERRGGR